MIACPQTAFKGAPTINKSQATRPAPPAPDWLKLMGSPWITRAKWMKDGLQRPPLRCVQRTTEINSSKCKFAFCSSTIQRRSLIFGHTQLGSLKHSSDFGQQHCPILRPMLPPRAWVKQRGIVWDTQPQRYPLTVGQIILPE